jgi:hypothetical protein
VNGRSVVLRALGDARVVMALFAALITLGAAMWLFRTIHNDVSWYIYSAGALLDGGRLYDDIFFEVNPPLMLYLTVPGVAGARLFGVFPIHGYVATVFALMALSLALTSRVLSRMPDFPDTDRRGFLLLCLVVLVIVPAGDLGQRSHVMLMLALPYMALIALRARGESCGAGFAVLLGVLAGVGFSIKPHYLVVPLVLELYLVVRSRKPGGMFRPETRALAGAVIAYLAAVVAFTPEYLGRVVPWALEVYNGAYRNDLVFVLARIETFLLPCVLFLQYRTREAQRVGSLGDVFVLAAAAFFLSYVAQMKGWNYQILPVTTMILLALAAYIAGGIRSRHTDAGDTRDTGDTKTLPARTASPVILLAAIPLFLLPGKAIVQGDYLFPARDRLVPIVREHAAGSSMYFFSSNTYTAFPLVVYAEVEWASRFASLWLVPGVERWLRTPQEGGADAGSLETLAVIDRYTRDSVVADLTRFEPAIIVVDARDPKPWYDGTGFDFIEHFSSDPRFTAIWERYELIDGEGVFEVYRRCDGPCDASSEPG